MSYRTRDTIRDRFDEVDSLNSRLNRLLNRPDIDEMNDRMEVKKNTKWNYGLSVSKNISSNSHFENFSLISGHEPGQFLEN